MSYDLCRLRLWGLIRRLPGQHRYVLTDDGHRFAVSYSRLGDRLLPALFAADQPNSPARVRRALVVIDGCVNDYIKDAWLALPPELVTTSQIPGAKER
jgi:hypothetical protein